jgi:AsmA protein
MRWFFRIVGVLLTLAVVAVAALFLIPGERIAQLAAQQFEAATGRALTFEGEVRPTVWPVLGATTGPVTLANAAWSEEGPMLAADGLEIGLDLYSLMRGEIAIRNVEALRPRIVLERAADGRTNWDFAGTGAGGNGAGGGGGTRDFSLDRAAVSNGALTFLDHGAGTRVDLTQLDANLSLPALDGPATLVASGQLDGAPFAIDGRVESMAAALAGRAVPLALTAEAAGSSVFFDGRLGRQPMVAEGSFALSLRDLPELLALAGLAAPDLPPDLTGGLETSGQVTLTPEGSLHLRGAALRLAGIVFEATDLDFAQPEGADGPATLALSGRMGGAPLAVEARVGAFSRALAGAEVPVRLNVRADESRIAFDGRAGHAPQMAEGRLDVSLRDLPGLFAMVGQPAPDLPPALRQPMAVAGHLSHASDGRVQLTDATLTMAGNRLTGQAGLVPGAERPRITARLDAGALDLSTLTEAGAGAGGAGQAGDDGWSTALIDASALWLADADVTLAAQSVNLGTVQLGATRASVALDRARAVTTLHELRLHDGNLTGEFVVNNRSGLSMGGDLRASGMALRPLLQQVAGIDRLSGTGSGRLRFLAVGNSVDALMRGLSGEGRIDFGQGEIAGFDLAGMLRNLDLSYVGEGNRTIYDSLSGSFTIANGVLLNDDLRMEARRVTVDGRGNVDIGRQRLDYRVQPRAFADGEGAGGARVPLLITGPWSEPRLRLDLEALARERLDVEREELERRAREEVERLEQRAREAAEQELRNRLDLNRQEGERPEDAARRALEREAERGLRRLLGLD